MSIFKNYKLKSAQKLLDRGFVEKALDKFSTLYKFDQNNIQILVGLANCNLAISNTQKALRFAEKAIEVAPDSLDAQICFCEVHISINYPVGLLRSHSQIIKSLEYGVPYATALSLNLENGDVTDELFSQVIEGNGHEYYQLPIVFYRLASALYDRNDHERELDCAELGLIMFPDNALLSSRRANANLNLENFNDAKFDLEKILGRNNRNFICIRNYAYLFRQLKNFNQAIVAYNDALELRPKSSDIWEGLATSYRKIKSYQEALEAAQNALQYSYNGKNLGWVYYELAFSSWKLEKLEDSKTYFLNSIRYKPGEYWFHKSLSELCFQMNNQELGEKHLMISESLSMDNMLKKDLNAMFDASDGL